MPIADAVPTQWVNTMDHTQFRWLQFELSRLLSQVLGEEVSLTPLETLRVLWTLRSGSRDELAESHLSHG